MEKKAKLRQENKPEVERTRLIARCNFAIIHNGYHRDIRAGEDISDVPAMYHPNLVTEGVIAPGKGN